MFKRRPPRYPTDGDDPEWVVYRDAPPMVADREFYRLMLAFCREDWDKTRDPQALHTARSLVLMHRQQEPNWLRDLVDAGYLRPRTPKQTKRYLDDFDHRARWQWVKRYVEAGSTWEEARAKASDRLAGTRAHGGEDTMKRSYELIERRRKVRLAEEALQDWLAAKDPPEHWSRIPASKISIRVIGEGRHKGRD
jgi:hypothetical protein